MLSCLINPIIGEECSFISAFIFDILGAVNDNVRCSEDPIVIDLYLDSSERLIDVPGIDEETAWEIVKIRTLTRSLKYFIQKNNFGFDLLTEMIQWDVGLLARQEMIISYNGLQIG